MHFTCIVSAIEATVTFVMSVILSVLNDFLRISNNVSLKSENELEMLISHTYMYCNS